MRPKEEVARLMYGAIKLIKPQAQVGWHIYHWVGWQAIYRAEMDYAEMVSYSDWLKPVVYHDIAGPRIRNMHIGRLHKSVLKDLSEEQSLDLLYAIMGYDPKNEPGLDELNTKGLSARVRLPGDKALRRRRGRQDSGLSWRRF